MVASRTASITITNRSDDALVREDHFLDHGVWGDEGRQLPPERIRPGEELSFGAESDGVMTGSEGWVRYGADRGAGRFTIRWDVPWWENVPIIEPGFNSYVRVEDAPELLGLHVESERHDSSSDHLGLEVTVHADPRRYKVELSDAVAIAPGTTPGAASWLSGTVDVPGRLDVLANTTESDGQRGLVHKYFDRGWHPSETVESGSQRLSGGVRACSWAPGRLDAFSVGWANHGIWHVSYSEGDGGWGYWDDLGGGRFKPHLPPAAVSWGTDRIDVFAVGDDDSLRHTYWDAAWGAWETLDSRLGKGDLANGLGVSSPGPGAIDLYTLSREGSISVARYANGRWSGWKDNIFVDAGLQITSAPAGFSRGAEIQVYAVAEGGDIVRLISSDRGSTWRRDVVLKSTSVWGGVGVVSAGPGRVDLFGAGLGANGRFAHAFSKDGGQSFKQFAELA